MLLDSVPRSSLLVLRNFNFAVHGKYFFVFKNYLVLSLSYSQKGFVCHVSILRAYGCHTANHMVQLNKENVLLSVPPFAR